MSKIKAHQGEDIRPISELRNYNKLLEEVAPDHPIVLTKNGYGKYAVVDLNDYYEFRKAKLVAELDEMIHHARQGETKPLDEVMKDLNR